MTTNRRIDIRKRIWRNMVKPLGAQGGGRELGVGAADCRLGASQSALVWGLCSYSFGTHSNNAIQMVSKTACMYLHEHARVTMLLHR